MPVRSFKVKLVTRSGDAEHMLQLRRGLWKTHEIVNQGIAYYMNKLALMRQEPYAGKSREVVRLELLHSLRAQQKRNNWTGDAGTDDEILNLSRRLYELLVPSAIGEKGDAQMLSRKFLSPLVDPNSEGGKGTAKSGRKPRWMKMREEGHPDWEAEREKDRAKKAADPTASILNDLEAFGLRPLFPLFTDEQKGIQWLPKQKRQFVRTFDRDMFQQALERMLSWESWNRRVAEEYQKLQAQRDELYAKYLADGGAWLEALQSFEKQREVELAEESFAAKSEYLITRRQIRGWKQVYEKWSQLPEHAAQEQFWQVVADVQTSLPGAFGDPKVYQFLSQPEHHHIWRGYPNRLFHYSDYNGVRKKLQRARHDATFTLPDPVEHPLWIRFDARGGNIHDYEISQNGKQYQVTFSRLLWPENETWVERENVTVAIGASQQLKRQIRLDGYADKKQKVRYRDYSSGIELTGVLGGAKIQFDRRHLRKASNRLADGETGPVYLNVVVDIEPFLAMRNGRLQTPIGQVLQVNTKDWPKVTGYKPAELISWIQNSPLAVGTGVNTIEAGMRVMSVDLGQRSAAAVSIFEVMRQKPAEQETKLFYPIAVTGLYAVHRRSLLLRLPGEKISDEIEQQRKIRAHARSLVRYQIRLLADVLRLHTRGTAEQRRAKLDELLATLQTKQELDQKLWQTELEKLFDYIHEPAERWQQALVAAHRTLEPVIGQAVRHWRKSLRIDRKGLAGMSMWNIEELEETRKLLIAWSKHSRVPGEPNRLDKEETFAPQQLQHIQNVKDDRLKQMANLLVMTALGYKYDEAEKQWKEAYPACQMILFEDLSRYRFALDRPRRENNRLMKWAHRSIPRLVYLQGELFGIQVGDVYSAYTSRFHAKTGAPGIRCHALKEEDLQPNSYVVKQLIKDGFIREDQTGSLKPGQIVPWSGGELFVTLADRSGSRLAVIHADINAAQNLQKRFWQQNTEIFRVPCKVTTSGLIPAYDKMKKLFGKGYFAKINQTDTSEVYVWEHSAKMKGKTTPADPAEEGVFDESLTDEMEELEDSQEGYKTLFRDPSGFFWSSDRWLPQKEFWFWVKRRIEKKLREQLQ
ncbi:type V CRISPR-associated protein Cas12b [Brevibacillus sp. SYP-B805]|uniref:type V CRISPR-associated protein Cas12b n=1 Tax=Brevibacillus sp. SYP-B805 TaxID=1578199 RepID=UPI0013EA9D08|nr:type V CRISPR-associated protein Cas12b [Brevibacillus sp. SYP-B805]NGQ97006.1 type V CRISPR-associated protein Cas12b [Brevibacillus sp. SYP-B805]